MVYDPSQSHTFNSSEPDNLSQALFLLRKWKAPQVTLSINNIIRARYLSRGGIEGCDFSGLDLHGVNILPYINGQNSVKKTNFNNTHIERKNFFFAGHTDEIICASFNSNGRKIVTVSIDNKICVWDSETGFLLNYFLDNILSISYAEFCPDDVFISAVSATGKVVFLDSNLLTLKGEVIIRLNDEMEKEYYLNTLVHNNAGNIVAIASNDGNIYLVDTAHYNVMRVLSGHRRAATSVRFSPDDKTILSASEDGRAIIWDAKTGDIIKIFAYGTQYDKTHQYAVWYSYADFSPDCKNIVVTTTNGQIVNWNISDCEKPLYVIAGYNNAINFIRYSPNGKELAATTGYNSVDIFDSFSGKPIR